MKNIKIVNRRWKLHCHTCATTQISNHGPVRNKQTNSARKNKKHVRNGGNLVKSVLSPTNAMAGHCKQCIMCLMPAHLGYSTHLIGVPNVVNVNADEGRGINELGYIAFENQTSPIIPMSSLSQVKWLVILLQGEVCPHHLCLVPFCMLLLTLHSLRETWDGH